IGPQVDPPTSWTHIHVGNPTSPTRPGPCSGTIPISTARRFIDSTAARANSCGSGGAPQGGEAAHRGIVSAGNGSERVTPREHQKIAPSVRPLHAGSLHGGCGSAY